MTQVKLKRLWNNRLGMWEDEFVWQEWEDDMIEDFLYNHPTPENLEVIEGYFQPSENPMSYNEKG